MPRRAPLILALVGVLLTTVGCQGDVPLPAAPTGAADSCNHPPDTGGGGQRGADGGLGAGFDYSDAHNAFGTAAPMTLCMTTQGTVRVTGSSPGITVSPETLTGEGPLFEFLVTVAPGGTGHLELELLNDRGEAGVSFHGPGVTSDDSGWAFAG